MRPRDTAALILVAIALAFAALAIGGAPRWAACASAALCLATAVPYVTSRRTASSPSPLLYPLALAAGLTALQLVPLPRAIAEQLVPAKLALVTENATAWGDAPPSWTVASFDPPATLVELAKLCGYLALAWTCVRLSAQRRARRWLAAAVAGVATLVALVTLAHHAVGATQVYGVRDPGVSLKLIGPILNPNHQSSLFGLAVPLALGLAIVSTGLVRAGWLVAAATLVATTLLGGSRGGVLGLAAGLIVATTLYVVQRRAGAADTHRRVPLSVAVPGVVVAVCAVVLIGVLAAGDVARELSRTSFDGSQDITSGRYDAWRASTSLIEESPWLGVGKGAFEHAFTRVTPAHEVTFSHVENSYLQAAIDWGLAGALALALALALVARAALAQWRHGPLAAGVLGALVSVAIHDLADFSLELPAVATAAIVAAAIVAHARLGTAQGDGGKRAPVARRVLATRLAALTAGALIVAAAASPLGRTARADHAHVVALTDATARAAAARAAFARHPASYMLAGRAAEALFAARDPRAVALVNRALTFHPRHGGVHHLAGRMLARSQRPEQAAVELAAAALWSRDPRPIVADVLAIFPDAALAANALPLDARRGARVMGLLGDRRDVALAYGRRLADAHPRDARVHAMLATVALADGRAGIAVDAARAAWELARTAPNATLLGRALSLGGDPAAAIAVMREAADSLDNAPISERVHLLFALADVLTGVADHTGAKQALERAASLAEGNVRLRIAVHERLAGVEDRLGNRNQAEWERARARELAAP